MKKTLLKMIAALAISILTIGCSESFSDPSNQNVSNVLGEVHLSAAGAYASEENIIILSLENKAYEGDEFDLTEKGLDCYKLKVSKDYKDIEFEIEDSLAIEWISVQDTLNYDTTTFTKGDKSTISLKADRVYNYCVSHDGSKKTPEVVFIRFLQESQDSNASPSRAFDQKTANKISNTNGCTGDQNPTCDLHGVKFSEYGTDFTGKDFHGANLSGANFSGLTFDDANLSGADISKAIFSKTSLTNAQMDNLDIHSTLVFTPSKINGAKFTGSNLSAKNKLSLQYSIFNERPVNGYENMDFLEANLSHVNMSSVKFIGTQFVDADLSHAKMQYSTFQNVNFRHANLSNAQMSDGIFSNLNFIASNLYNANTTGADFSGSAFNGANGLDSVNIKFQLELIHMSRDSAGYSDHYYTVKDKSGYCVSKNSATGGIQQCSEAALWNVRNENNKLVIKSDNIALTTQDHHSILVNRTSHLTWKGIEYNYYSVDRWFRSTSASDEATIYYAPYTHSLEEIFYMSMSDGSSLSGATFTQRDYNNVLSSKYVISDQTNFGVSGMGFYLIAK